MVAKDRQGLVEYRPGRIVAVGGVENFVDLFGRVQPDDQAGDDRVAEGEFGREGRQ